MSDPTSDQSSSSPRRGRALWVTIGVLAAILVGGYAAAVYAASGDVPAGTTVRGVGIGGMSAEEAAATLEAELGEAAAEPFEVTAGDSTMEIDPGEAGLAVDWEATAAQSSGIILSPAALWAHLSGDVELSPITTSDPDALAASLEALALVVDEEAVEPSISFSKKAVAALERGQDGVALDVPAAAELVAEQYFQVPDAGIALPTTAVTPTVTDEEAERVMSAFAEPAVALPVVLTVGEVEVSVPPTAIAAALSFDVKDGTLAPELDGEELHESLAEELAPLERPGRDARFRIEGDRPVIVPSRNGREVDEEDLASAVLAVLPEAQADARVATVAVSATEPDLTTAEAEALNITEKLSSFRQWFPPAEYRYINVGTAARYLNGTILEPGETFSMNDTVKERTAANGYTQGFIISGGRFREELGGGVSIITTATWTAGFYAGLERVEQRAHNLYIDRYKAGLEATVAWGLLDLKMRNDTGNGVLITATRYNDGVLVEMWGTKKYDSVTATFTERTNYTPYETIYDDGEGCVPSSGSRGFSISVTRRLIKDGTVVKAETWPTTYRPTPNVICGPKPGSGDDTTGASQ